MIVNGVIGGAANAYAAYIKGACTGNIIRAGVGGLIGGAISGIPAWIPAAAGLGALGGAVGSIVSAPAGQLPSLLDFGLNTVGGAIAGVSSSLYGAVLSGTIAGNVSAGVISNLPWQWLTIDQAHKERLHKWLDDYGSGKPVNRVGGGGCK
jgi:hypothetical protein